MKILHYTPTYAPAWQYGGPILCSSQLCETLVRFGHSVDVVTTNAGLDNIQNNEQTMRNGVSVRYMAFKYFLGIHSKNMEQYVVESVNKYDIVHISGVWQPTITKACQECLKRDIPYILSLHGSLSPYSWSQKTFKKYIYYLWRERYNTSKASGIHYTTLSEKNETNHLKLPRLFSVIPNGLDTNIWNYDELLGSDWRKKNLIEKKTFLILYVGRLHHKKGLDLIPEILGRISGLDWKMVFVGNDDNDGTKKNLIKKFKEKKIINKVLFCSSVEPTTLPCIYSAADIFILPSLHENFGNVTVEALSCGCPVIVSDNVGVGEDLLSSKAAWRLPLKIDSWVSLIQSFIVNNKKLKISKLKCRDWVKKNMDIEITTKKMNEFYDKVIQSKN